jgi:hypothetical protein
MDNELNETTARTVNAEPWEPLPGMVKLRCTTCHYFFAASTPDVESCPDCARLRRPVPVEQQQEAA